MKKKKHYYGQGQILSVYRFMEYCGLDCPKKENILISHEIMMRKLALRHEKFPDKVSLPVRMSLKKIDKNDVYEGRTFLVKDDYKNILPYYVPKKLDLIEEAPEEEFARRRKESLLEESLEVKKEMPNGYIRYLIRKNKRELLEEKKILIEIVQYDRTHPEEKITEKKGRLEKVKNRKRRY